MLTWTFDFRRAGQEQPTNPKEKKYMSENQKKLEVDIFISALGHLTMPIETGNEQCQYSENNGANASRGSETFGHLRVPEGVTRLRTSRD